MFQSKKFKKVAQEVESIWNIPSIVYGIVVDGKLIEVNSVGKANEDKLFRIGSNGKSMTAAMLLNELNNQGFGLYDCLMDINKAMKFSDEALASKIQVIDLLTHNTGHGKFTSSMMAYLGYREDELANAFKHIPFLKSPGSSFQYQNGLYLLAGKLIEYLANNSINNYFQEHLYTPLEMNKTYMGMSNTPLADLAVPYHGVSEKENVVIEQSAFSDALSAGANINTSAFDLAQWIKFNLKINRECTPSIYSKQFFPYITFTQDLNPEFCLNSAVKWNGYGLGWYLNSFDNHDIFEHLGGVPGYTSFMSFSPALNAGIVIMCNKTDMRYPIEFLRAYFYAQLSKTSLSFDVSDLHKKTTEYTSSLKNRVAYKIVEQPSSLKDLLLTFSNPQYGQVVLSTKNNMPSISFDSANYYIPLAYIGGNSFLAKDDRYNFNTSLKQVIFKLSPSFSQLNMTIQMDNQRGDLTPVEEQVFKS